MKLKKLTNLLSRQKSKDNRWILKRNQQLLKKQGLNKKKKEFQILSLKVKRLRLLNLIRTYQKV